MDHAKKTILLVEDEAILALDKAHCLKNLGYGVIHALDGETAVETVRSSPGSIDLVLMDINLGEGIDGTETARKIHELREIPVVFLSAHTEKNVVEKTESVTSYGYIVKNSGMTVLDASIKMAFKLFNANNTCREREEEYRSIVQNQHEMICRFLPDTTLTFVNDAYCRNFGKRSDELSGTRFLDLVPREDHAPILERIERARTTRQPIEFEHRVIYPDGSTGWQSWKDSPILDRDGAVAEFQSVGMDITERKRAEDALRANEDLYRTLAETSPDMIYLVDRDRRISYVNTVAAMAFMKAPEEIRGRKLEEVFSPGIAERHWAAIGRVMETGMSLASEAREAFPSGEVWIDARLSPVRGRDGAIVAVLGVSTDISGRKKTEAALLENERSLTGLSDSVRKLEETIVRKEALIRELRAR
ncbi:MAG: PAS domain S-box protein [Spirochaetes bacterium]|nr:PAS domain S-box protein [Spirochaetota bacterium]